MPKYLLALRKTSFFLKAHNSNISFGSNKACSRAEATWRPIPPLKSRIDASSLKGSPLSMGVGSQVWGSGGWVSAFSMPWCDSWLTFCFFAAHWASSSWVRRDLLVSITSLPSCSLFLFGLACSVLEGRDGWGGGKWYLRGGGSLGWANFPGAPLPGWSSINSIKLFWGFLWIPISSGISSGDWVQLNTSNSSEDSDKSTTSSRFFFSFFFFFFFQFSFLFLLFLRNRLGWGCSHRRSGHKEWLIEWCTLGDRNAFRNHESFVGNTNAMEPWIFGPYHTLGGLECTGNGRVPED